MKRASRLDYYQQTVGTTDFDQIVLVAIVDFLFMGKPRIEVEYHCSLCQSQTRSKTGPRRIAIKTPRKTYESLGAYHLSLPHSLSTCLPLSPFISIFINLAFTPCFAQLFASNSCFALFPLRLGSPLRNFFKINLDLFQILFRRIKAAAMSDIVRSFATKVLQAKCLDVSLLRRIRGNL